MLLPAPSYFDQNPKGATLVLAPILEAEASALSYDGKTLVGSASDPGRTEKRAFAWRLDTGPDQSSESGIQILSDPGSALALSDDGSLIVGNGLKPGRAEFEGGRWIGTIPSVEPPWGPRIGGIAAGVSGDGSVVVGSAILNYAVRSGRGSQRAEGIGEAAILRAVKSDPTSEAAPLDGVARTVSASDGTSGAATATPLLPLDSPVEGLGLGWGSAATAVSRDGFTVVGVLPKAGPGFRWSDEAGALAIGDLPGGAIETIPTAVSGDGSVIVGSARSANGQEAFRWTEAKGLVPLGDLPGIAFRSVARAVSVNGKIVVGTGAGERQGESGGGDRAFIWDAEHGMRDLWKVLADQGAAGAGLPPKFARWRLRDAMSVRVTADGHPQIAGTAIDEVGRRLAFVATLGETVAP